MYIIVQGPRYIVEAAKAFSLHFDIRLSDFVALEYGTKRRLAIGNS